ASPCGLLEHLRAEDRARRADRRGTERAVEGGLSLESQNRRSVEEHLRRCDRRTAKGKQRASRKARAPVGDFHRTLRRTLRTTGRLLSSQRHRAAGIAAVQIAIEAAGLAGDQSFFVRT